MEHTEKENIIIAKAEAIAYAFYSCTVNNKTKQETKQ